MDAKFNWNPGESAAIKTQKAHEVELQKSNLIPSNPVLPVVFPGNLR